MKTALLAVYFGSSDLTSMHLLEQDLRQAFPEVTVFRAFLRSDAFPSVTEALAQLQTYDRVVVQPMLVSDGPAYRQLHSLCSELPIGAPLLASPDACIHAMTQWLPRPLVLMGHGSSGCSQTAFAAQFPRDLHFALLNGEPALEDILPQVTGQPIHLAPFLLTCGKHTSRDLALWKQRLEQNGCCVILHQESLAQCAAIRAVFVQHAKTILYSTI